jgi:flagellar biosynthesis/type III secretory pathway chaperone
MEQLETVGPSFTLLDYYHELTLLWRELCIHHTQLFETTNQEYQLLLAGETDQLESNLGSKKALIEKIQNYDLKRQTSVEDVFKYYSTNNNTSFHYSRLIELFNEKLNLNENNELDKYNIFLVEIIDKIQIQNRKNRQFLNRALIMMEDLKKDFKNTGKVLSYNKKGNLQHHTR